MQQDTSTVLDRVVATLFGKRAENRDDEADRQLIGDVTDLVVDVVEPRIRHYAKYRRKLEPCIRRTVAHLRAVGRENLDPVPLTRAAWREDPRVNAFFATADDVPLCLGRSAELREFFDNAANRDVKTAYALLGMKKEEREVFAPQLVGDRVVRDVPQTTLGFAEHRIVAPSSTLEATRLEIGRRIVQRLAQIALDGITAVQSKASTLEARKAYLSARLRQLQLARDGMAGVVGDPANVVQQMQAVAKELKSVASDHAEAKASMSTLEAYIEHIDAVFAHPEQHVTLTHTPLRVSHLGFKVEDASASRANELTLAELSIGEGLRGAVALVMCPRSELPPKRSPFAR